MQTDMPRLGPRVSNRQTPHRAVAQLLLLTSIAAFHFPGHSGHAAQPKANAPFENSLGMKFVPVAGTSVLVSIFETRVKDFEAFASATGYKTERKMYTWIDKVGKQREGYDWREPGYAQGPNHPVGGVSWNDAQEFCRWLTQKEQSAGAIGRNQRYRLPTDQEWSATLGLTAETGTTPSEKDKKIKDVYPWGAPWPPRFGNYGDVNYALAPGDTHYKKEGSPLKDYNDGFQYSAPVGSFQPNAFGIYDLGGNVYEWVEDEYGGQGKTARNRVMRGGGFNSNGQAMLLSSNRITFDATDRSGNHGFRCVLEVVTPAK